MLKSDHFLGRVETGKQLHHPDVERMWIKGFSRWRQPGINTTQEGILRQEKMSVLPDWI